MNKKTVALVAVSAILAGWLLASLGAIAVIELTDGNNPL